MSIFNELLPKIVQISDVYIKTFNDRLQDALARFDKFEEEFKTQNGRNKTREKAQKDKTAMITLQSIDEGEDEPKKSTSEPADTMPIKSSSLGSQSSDTERSAAKKRSKHEVEDMSSPEPDKRLKRNASVKAQSIISKQVNVNLSSKLRRENSLKDASASTQATRGRRNKNEEKENVVPDNLPVVQIKQEKLSIPAEPEPMEMECVPDVPVKQETKDDIAMPPPAMPVPKSRKAALKEKSQDVEDAEENTNTRSRRSTRTKKQDAPPVSGARSTRSHSRVLSEDEAGHVESAPAPTDARPKRTRGRKKLSEMKGDSGNSTQSSQESLPASPTEKPRPKRTRRGQKADKEQVKTVEPQPIISTKDEKHLVKEISSPIIPQSTLKDVKNKRNKTQTIIDFDKTKEINKTYCTDKDSSDTKNSDKDSSLTKNITKSSSETKNIDEEEKIDKTVAKSKTNTKINGVIKNKTVKSESKSIDEVDNIALDETRVLSKAIEMDQTMVLPTSVFNHAQVTPKSVQHAIMDATVVIDKGATPTNLTDDNSILTSDNDSQDIPETPPKKGIPENQPASAVKEKVQQFEEMASRVTRTKTRAMAKKVDDKDTQNLTPPDKVCKVVLSSETLTKMNNLIFNGKAPQHSSSACKPRALPTAPAKSVTSSASKAISRRQETSSCEDVKEDPRKKKDALLVAKREEQRRKREEKIAAAAAARSQAERERKALLEAAARERMEKQAHAENERIERLKEVERKKQELARKALETEERRRAEEAARQQRLAEEQRRAKELRRKQLEEQEAMKREEARMNKEIEKKHREYLEKQKKQKIDKMNTPFKTPGTPLGNYNHHQMPPVYMEDGFQYLNSDEDADPPEAPVPIWSTSKIRRQRLQIQSLVDRSLVDRLYSVRVHSPDLRDIFPRIDRARLKRTSSAVWRTPPPHPPHH